MYMLMFLVGLIALAWCEKHGIVSKNSLIVAIFLCAIFQSVLVFKGTYTDVKKKQVEKIVKDVVNGNFSFGEEIFDMFTDPENNE